MSWEIGYDEEWQRDIGYGVPATCDHPDCNSKIDRGIAYVCGAEIYGGEDGCGLFFCSAHQVGYHQRCERCVKGSKPYAAKADHPDWMRWKLSDDSWEEWRTKNPKAVAAIKDALDRGIKP